MTWLRALLWKWRTRPCRKPLPHKCRRGLIAHSRALAERDEPVDPEWERSLIEVFESGAE